MDFSTGIVTSLSSVLSTVGYSLRYELAFCACALFGWYVSFTAQGRGEKARAQRQQMKNQMHAQGPGARASKQRKHDDPKESEAHELLLQYQSRARAPEAIISLFERHRRSQVLTSEKPELLQEILSLVYSSAIRNGLSNSLPDYIGDAMKLGVPPRAEQLESMVKMCTAKKSFVEALRAADASRCKDAEFQGTAATWSCLLFCAVEAGQLDRCEAFYEKLTSLRGLACEDFMNMIRFIAHTKQPDRLAPLLKQMELASPKPDNIAYNRALAVCVSAEQLGMAEMLLGDMKRVEGVCDAITYNTLIKGYVRAGKVERCFELQEEMLKQGVKPSEVTFGILLDACVEAGMPNRATQIFKDFQTSGLGLNAVMYTTLLKGLAKAGQIDQAMDVFEQMCGSDVVPDLVSYSVMTKVCCDAGRLEEALQLLQRLVQQGLAPDEIMYNNLISGCAERKSSALGQRLIEDMMQHNIRPSNVTLSIMLKMYIKCKEWDAALELLDSSSVKFGLPSEHRLYLQFVQGCIRERLGKRALEGCEAMLRRCPPDEVATGKLLQQCSQFNMLDSGADLLECLRPPRGRVHPKDANALLAMALKKRKAVTVKSILGSMQKGGIPVDNDNRAAGPPGTFSSAGPPGTFSTTGPPGTF